jgi:hypothetical protein
VTATTKGWDRPKELTIDWILGRCLVFDDGSRWRVLSYDNRGKAPMLRVLCLNDDTPGRFDWVETREALRESVIRVE